MANIGLQRSTSLFRSPGFLIALLVLTALFMGAISAIFASELSEHYGALLALPGAIIIGFLFLIDRYTLFMMVIMFRSVMDPVFETTKLGSFGLGAVLNALVILIALIAVMQRPVPVSKVVRQTWLFFLMTALIAIVIAPQLLAAIKSYLTLLSYVAVFAIAIVVIKTEDDYGRWMRAVFISSIIPVLYAFVDIANGGFKGHDTEGFRISSTFAHPNGFGFYLVLMISLGFYFFKTQVNYIPTFWLKKLPAYILLMIVLLVLTKTRSAWVACFIYFTLYALIYERKYLVFIFLTPVIAFSIPEVRERILDITRGNEVIHYSALNSYAWRKLIWSDSLSWMTPSHYFFGYGLQSFTHYSPTFFSLAGGNEHGAHSVYVQLIFEAGAVGLVAFLWIPLKLVRLLLSFYQLNKLMIFSAVMLLVEFAFEAYSDNMLDYLSFNWYLWFVLGAAYAVNYSSAIKPSRP